MRKGVDGLVGQRRSVARPAAPADEAVTFPSGGEAPSWATATGLFQTLGNRTLSNGDAEATQPMLPVEMIESARPSLERRTPTVQAAAVSWRTTLGEPVGIGDLVALRGLNNPDAMGLIVDATNEGAPVCVLGGFEEAPGSRLHPRVCVVEDNLRALLRKAGGGEPIDTKRF